jgi:hypothetical protein
MSTGVFLLGAGVLWVALVWSFNTLLGLHYRMEHVEDELKALRRKVEGR